MINSHPSSSLPSLDDMLQSLLIIEEGEHEFAGEEEGIQELRQLFAQCPRRDEKARPIRKCAMIEYC